MPAEWRRPTGGFMVAVATVALSSCTGRVEESERFQFQRAEWKTTQGPVANHTTLVLQAQVFFTVDTSAPPTRSDDLCGLDEGSIKVVARPGVLGTETQGEVDIGTPAIVKASTENDVCQVLCETNVTTVAAGMAGLELRVLDRNSITIDLEIREVGGVFVSLEGQRRLAMVPGKRALLSVTRADQQGRPLLGSPLTLLGGAPLAELAQAWPPDAWWFTGLQPGVVMVEIDGLESPQTLQIELVAYEQLTGLRFFTLQKEEACCDLMWQPLVWSDALGETLSVHRLEEVKLVATPVDDQGRPVWAGAETMAYSVPQYPVVTVAAEEMHWGTVAVAGSLEVHGMEWLSVLPLRPGTATISATFREMSATLDLLVQ